jgi:protein-S-isoprenylcysteine O-methyltransferase Ste14
MKRTALALSGETVPMARRAARYDLSEGHPQPRTRHRRFAVGEVGAKIIIVLLFSAMAIRLASDWLKTGHLTGMLLLASEGLVVALTLVRRSAAVVDRSWKARLLTGFSTWSPNLVMPLAAGALAPQRVTVAITAAGLFVVVLGKLSIGRSFGLSPANRGVVSTGLYRLVRHPIYFGYLVTHLGFVLANPMAWNVSVLVAADLALMCRAVREELTLANDDLYCAYMQRVRWRMLPGLF